MSFDRNEPRYLLYCAYVEISIRYFSHFSRLKKMAKKAAAKKGKAKVKTEEQSGEQKDKLLEVDKEWFQVQIRSLEEKLERRNDRAKNLETSNKEYQERFEQLREDKADVVAFLKRALQQRTDQISELQARLEGLQHVHETDGKAYEKKIADMKQELERTKEQLGSENMVLTKKLDALEEFRIQREQLMAKFDEQETKVEEQKQFYESKIYEQEKKHIIEEDRLKRDMMSKLESVAAEFRKAANAQMSATTQRTIRENINISSQVQQLSEKAADLASDNESLKIKNTEKQRKIELLDDETKRLVKRNAYRLKVIEDLTSKNKKFEEQLASLNSFYSERRNYQNKIKDLEEVIDDLNSKLGSSTATTKDREASISNINKKLTGLSKTKEMINQCLNEASGSIRAALALAEDESEADTKARREDVLNQLLVLLNTSVAEKKLEISAGNILESITEPSSGGHEAREDDIEYIVGSLGLVPPSDE